MEAADAAEEFEDGQWLLRHGRARGAGGAALAARRPARGVHGDDEIDASSATSRRKMAGGGRLRLALVSAAVLPAAFIAPPPTKLNVRFATSDDFKAIASLRTSIFSSHLTSLYSKIEQDRLFVDTMSKKSAVVAAVRPTDGAYLGCADVGREELPGRGVTACYVTSVCVHPDARRTGLARRMMSLAEAHAALALDACQAMRNQLVEQNAQLRQHNQLLRNCLQATGMMPNPGAGGALVAPAGGAPLVYPGVPMPVPPLAAAVQPPGGPLAQPPLAINLPPQQTGRSPSYPAPPSPSGSQDS